MTDPAPTLYAPKGPKPYRYTGHKTCREWFSRVMEQRAVGIYHNDDTLAEAAKSVHSMGAKDVCVTLIHNMGRFSVFNWAELAPQVAEWRKLKCVALECNLKQVTLQNWEGEGGTVWMLIVQPPDLEKSPMSPIALACSTLVSGYAYLFKNKEDADRVLSALKPAEAPAAAGGSK